MFDKKIGWNEAHYRIANYLEKKGDYDNAAYEYEAVIKVTPFNYFPNLELANLFMRQKKYKLAEATLKRAMTFSQNLPYAYAKLGLLYYFTDRPELAIKRLEQAVEKNKTSNRFKDDELAGAFYIMSMAYAKLGKLSLAKKAAKEALNIKPEYEEVKAIMKKLNVFKE